MIKTLSYAAVGSFALLLAVCGGGPKIVLDAESAAFYEHARLIMTSGERDMFTHITDAATRKEFIEDFWKKRDPDEYTEENEFKTEFYQRIEYANKRFKEGLPVTAGRYYIDVVIVGTDGSLGKTRKIFEIKAQRNLGDTNPDSWKRSPLREAKLLSPFLDTVSRAAIRLTSDRQGRFTKLTSTFLSINVSGRPGIASRQVTFLVLTDS
ncbi:MAG: GWxTD domain-containing protein [Candidatus Aminicenantales bacterium]